MHETIITLILGIAMPFIVERFMRVFFGKRRTKLPVFVLSFLLYYVSNVVVFFLSGNTQIVALVTVISLSVITLNYETSWVKRICAVLSIYALLLSISSLLAVFFIPYFAPDAYSVVSTDIIFVASTYLMLFLMALLLQKFKSIKKDIPASPLFWVSVIATPVASLVILGIVVESADISPAAKALVFALAIGINMFVLYFHNTLSAAYRDKLKSQLDTQEKESYLAQCQLMQESLDQVISIRHDMKAHLAAINGYAAEAGAVKATDYISGLLGGMNAAKIHSDTGNVAIDSIINYKLRNAEQENIKLDIHLRVPPSLNIEASDIAAILGNLLDNALDAVKHVEGKWIKLDAEFSRGALFIHVENAFDGAVKYAGKGTAVAGTNGKRLPVTRKPVGDHGHGLRNVRRAVEKYNGYMDIAHEGNVFSVTVFLYVDEDEGQEEARRGRP